MGVLVDETTRTSTWSLVYHTSSGSGNTAWVIVCTFFPSCTPSVPPRCRFQMLPKSSWSGSTPTYKARLMTVSIPCIHELLPITAVCLAYCLNHQYYSHSLYKFWKSRSIPYRILIRKCKRVRLVVLKQISVEKSSFFAGLVLLTSWIEDIQLNHNWCSPNDTILYKNGVTVHRGHSLGTS